MLVVWYNNKLQRSPKIVQQVTIILTPENISWLRPCQLLIQTFHQFEHKTSPCVLNLSARSSNRVNLTIEETTIYTVLTS